VDWLSAYGDHKAVGISLGMYSTALMFVVNWDLWNPFKHQNPFWM